MVNERVWGSTQLAKLSFNYPSVVLTADAFRFFDFLRIKVVVEGGLRRGGLTTGLAPHMTVITEKCIYFVVFGIVKSRRYMQPYCLWVHEKKSCLNDEKENTGIRFNESATSFAIRHTMMNNGGKQLQLQQQQQYCSTQSSSSSNSDSNSSCMHKHMPSIYAVQYNVSGRRGSRLWNHTAKKKQVKKRHTQEKEESTRGVGLSTWDAHGVTAT